MKKDQDQNSTDSAEIEALITRIERGQLRSRLPMVGFLAVVAIVASRGLGR